MQGLKHFCPDEDCEKQIQEVLFSMTVGYGGFMQEFCIPLQERNKIGVGNMIMVRSKKYAYK